MSKGLLFWILWILAVLAQVGVAKFDLPAVWGTVTILVLFGLLGWHSFGPPIQ